MKLMTFKKNQTKWFFQDGKIYKSVTNNKFIAEPKDKKNRDIIVSHKNH